MIGRFATLALSMLTASAVASNPFSSVPVQSKNTKKASFVSKVMSNARPLRRLDEEEQEIDLSGYSIKYVKCQFVKSYDDEMAENEEAGTVLMTNRFIIFRLCPSSSCSYNYGEYLIDMATYLEAAVEYEQEQQEQMCQYCEEVCAADDDGGNRKLRRLDNDLKVSCDSCVDECEKIENMEDNGYVEASNFIECQQIGEDDDGTEYYAGAMCASNGEKIKIGVFMDEDCSQPDNSLSVEDYIEAKLSHAILKTIYNQESSISCIKPDWEVPEDDDGNQNGDEEEEEVEVNEMCNELYEGAAKCESKYGFQGGVANYEAYANQASQEDLVCSFIKTLSSGAYDQSGEIVLKSNVSGVDGATAATGGQKFALTVFILGSIGFAVYAAQLHSQLTSGSASGMSNQGGAMA
jgi:hypothetical protein